MKTKKILIILSLFLILICCSSAISAVSDDIIDNQVSEIESGDESISNSNDEQAISVDQTSSALNTDEESGEEKLTNFEDTPVSKDESDEKLSVIYAIWYSITLSDEYQISAHAQGSIKYHRVPCPDYLSTEAYHYYITVFDVNMNKQYQKEISGTSRTEGDYTHKIAANSINPGSYIIAFINYDDAKVLDTAILKVSGNAAISANNYNSNYMSGAGMYARLTDSVTGKALSALSVKVVFTKGKTSVTRYYTPNSNGEISFVPPVGVGTWSVTITPAQSHITGSVVKTATIKKSKVSVKAKKVTEYKGYKTTLKATVKSNGKNVNEGKVTFKINGKSYKANVKNGVATKKIKLNKIKKYKYTAKYNGNANLAKSKKAKANAVLKKRLNVKVKFNKKLVVYAGKGKKITAKITANGKKVKDGWLKVKNKYGVEKVKVKKGTVKLYLAGNLADLYKGNNGITTYYKKSLTRTYWVKYVPESHKYYPKKVKYKTTTKYRCTQCGKKSSHDHYDYGYFVRYVYHIKVS